jgi:glycosyltransferase involved in cell wall biosynthesis
MPECYHTNPERIFDPTGPLAFFAYTYVNGGGAQCTVQLVRELRRVADVKIVDVYGACAEYMASLEEIGLSPIVLYSDYASRTTIGSQGNALGLAKTGLSIPHILGTAARLRQVLRQIKPRAVWVDDEKALFVIWLALLTAQEQDIPLVYLVRAQLPRIRPSCTLAWHRVDVALGVSADCLSYLRSTRYAHRNVQVLYSGIDVEHVQERARPEPEGLPAHSPETMCIVFPAVISDPLKGHEVGIRAIAEYVQSGGQVQLWVCGGVPPEVSPAFRDRMMALTFELGIQKQVHFLGWRDDILAVMARADAIMLPSFTEGLPRSLLEAMALAKPILATRVGGIPELVREGIDGILTDPGDIKGLAQALETISDPTLRRQMGTAGQARARRDFSPEQEAQHFMDAIRAVLNAKHNHQRQPSGERSRGIWSTSSK